MVDRNFQEESLEAMEQSRLFAKIKATNLIMLTFHSTSSLCDHSMLDSTSVLIPVLGGICLVVMITVFLKRRKPDSIKQDKNDRQEPFVVQQNAVDQQMTAPKNGQPSSRSVGEVEEAREELKALNLQRQIITSALSSIFEAEAQGRISRISRDSLVETYGTQLKALDEQIAGRKKITEFSDLLNEKEQLEKDFERRIAEISERLKQFSTAGAALPTPSSDSPQSEMMNSTNTQPSSSGSIRSEEKSAEKTKNKTEERIQAIREEVLKAIERLEKIESEG